MFDLTGRKALVTGATAASAGPLPARMPRARRWRSPNPRRPRRPGASSLGERVHLSRRTGRQGSVEALVPAAEAAHGGPRHSRQQRRHYARQPFHAHEGRGGTRSSP